MIEDIEVGSGCIADMSMIKKPAPSQRELEINDILNSKMLNKTKELFQVQKIVVKDKS